MTRWSRTLVRACGGGAAAGCLFLIAGCEKPDAATVEERRALTDRVTELERTVVAREDAIRTLTRQVQTLQGLGSQERLDRIPHAVRIELDSLTGGYDADGRPGHDGVVVYLRPYDQDGDVVKAAGAARIQLLDLANPTGAQEIGVYEVDEGNLRKTWYGKFLTSHYTIKCPWRQGPPVHPLVMVRVQFIDLLSGVSFEEVRQVKVELPPAS